MMFWRFTRRLKKAKKMRIYCGRRALGNSKPIDSTLRTAPPGIKAKTRPIKMMRLQSALAISGSGKLSWITEMSSRIWHGLFPLQINSAALLGLALGQAPFHCLRGCNAVERRGT
jgi:hypothetical protein